MRSFLKNSLFLSNQSPQSSLSGEPFNNNASSMLLTSLNFFLIFSSTGKSSDPIASLDSSVPYPNPNFKEVFEFDVIFPFLNRPLVRGSRILIILFPVFLFGLEIFFIVGVELNGVIKLVDAVIKGGGAEIRVSEVVNKRVVERNGIVVTSIGMRLVGVEEVESGVEAGDG
nr:hypothetical protein Itr_chr03CG01820 [Ipomoea trifida]